MPTEPVQLDFHADIPAGETGAGSPVFRLQIQRPAADLRGIVELFQVGARDLPSVGRFQIERIPELGGFITFTEEFLPDPCRQGALVGRSRLLLWGPSAHAREAVSDAVRMLAMALRPGALFALTGIPTEALAGEPIDLEDIWGAPARELAMRLAATTDSTLQVALLEQAVREQVDTMRLDQHARGVVEFVSSTNGDLRVTSLAKQIGYSERQLRRVLGKWIGLGPKAVRRVMRLRTALRDGAGQAKPDWASVAVSSGYHDQAHFSEECREMTGSPPQRLLTSVTAPLLVGEWGLLVRRREVARP